MLAREIAAEPSVRRTLRKDFFLYATISTSPTEKGKADIDASHPYRGIKRLREKPCPAFTDPTQFMKCVKYIPCLELLQVLMLFRILKAQKEGFLTYQIQLDNSMKAQMQSSLVTAFHSDGTSEVAQSWNDLRKTILDEALKEHLIPLFQTQLKVILNRCCKVTLLTLWQEDMTRKGEEAILNACTEVLEKQLMEGPYRPAQQHIDQLYEDEDAVVFNRIVVMACCYGDPRDQVLS